MATATLTFKEKNFDLPLLKGTLGEEVVNISELAKHDIYTYDPGFTATAACSSKITYIDGDAGVLLYRGYPIEQLAEKSDFFEVAYLLLNGELPTLQEKEQFVGLLHKHSMLHEQMRNFFNGFRRDAHPMAVMVGVVGALSAFYHDSLDIKNPAHRDISALRLIAKMPTIAAMCYKYFIGQPFVCPQNNRGYSDDFLNMMFSVPCEETSPHPVLVKALEKILILHADHEQNASTSTVRMVGSTGANPFACISAGIAALWGPAHGGANEAALNMLKEIGDESRIGHYIKRAKDPQDKFRLMGFGHRVYKHYDPRAVVMRQTCYEVLEAVGASNNALLNVAMKLEKIALEDDYFIQRKLYPNVDFYSGITLSAMGIPVNMFTVIFAMARTVGWISHWNEMIADPESKLSRPRQLYLGAAKRDYVPLESR